MSRWEFMRQLESLLFDISPNEREEALQYYNDYFNDAGRENEQEVIKALGSPEQVAKIVKDGLSENPGMGEFTENGFTSQETADKNAIIKSPCQEEGKKAGGRPFGSAAAMGAEGGNGNTGNTGNGYNENGSGAAGSQNTGTQKESGKKNDFPVWAIVLIVLGCVICSPAIIGIAGAVLGVIVSIFATVLALVLGFGLAALILIVVAIGLVAGGFGCVLSTPITAMGLVGGGLVCLALGILFLMLTVFLVGKLIPAVCQGIAYIFRKLFGKKEAVA